MRQVWRLAPHLCWRSSPDPGDSSSIFRARREERPLLRLPPMNQVQGVRRRAKGQTKARASATESGERSQAIRQRVEGVRDVVESVRERAEVVFNERPYLVPVAACAVGVGIGVLLSSRITRFMVMTAVGSLVSETVGGELKRVAGDFIESMQGHLEAMNEEEEPQTLD